MRTTAIAGVCTPYVIATFSSRVRCLTSRVKSSPLRIVSGHRRTGSRVPRRAQRFGDGIDDCAPWLASLPSQGESEVLTFAFEVGLHVQQFKPEHLAWVTSGSDRPCPRRSPRRRSRLPWRLDRLRDGVFAGRAPCNASWEGQRPLTPLPQGHLRLEPGHVRSLSQLLSAGSPSVGENPRACVATQARASMSVCSTNGSNDSCASRPRLRSSL